MSGNLFGEFAGITDASRIRKPPGGDTNNIFGLETRQKWQASQVYPNSEIETPKEGDQEHDIPLAGGKNYAGVTDKTRVRKPPGGDTHDIFNMESMKHDIPLAGGKNYAGVTDKTRVRKPPGGDTHDIFNMESRQRSQAMENPINLSSFMNLRVHDIGSSNIKDELKSGQLNSDDFDQLLLHVDKENINLLSEEEDILKKKSLGIDDDSNLPNKKYLIRNPITGEVSEMQVSACSKLADRSNATSSPCLPKKPDVKKTSVRVRQPPGGVSSHRF